MATSVFRRDALGAKLVTPASDSKDFLGRVTTSTTDYLGRLLIGKVFAGTTAYTLGEHIELAAGTPLFKVTVAGTTAAGAPTPPGYGLPVVSGTATLTQVHA